MGAEDGKTGHVTGEKQPNMDSIQSIVGAFGKYQFWLCLLVFISKFLAGFYQMSIIFLAPRISYYCEGTGLEECPCPDPVYNTSIFDNTIVMEWDLICDNWWMVSFNQTMFQLGVLVGSIIFGAASDRYGRKKAMLVAVTIQLCSGVATAFIPNYWGFTFLRFILGATVGATLVIGFVIVMEFVGTEYRETLAMVYQLPFNLGHLALPLFSYLFRDYVSFQLAIAVPAALMLSYFFLLPETPRWLVVGKKTEEAIHLLERMAKVNKKESVNIRNEVTIFQANLEASQLKKGTILDLFRTPNIRKRTIFMSINWLTCSYCYYGVTQYIGQLSGNIFVNVALSATVACVSCLIAIPLTKYLGRKSLIIGSAYTCGLSLIIMIFVPEGPGTVVLACIGVCGAVLVFVVIYLYTAELFPTVIRNAAVGFCSMIARIGSMVAPFVLDLEQIDVWLPPVVFAIPPILAATLLYYLPETKNYELMTTIEESERLGEKNDEIKK